MWNSVLEELKRRPWWMNLIWLFCLYMTFIYMPWDIFYKPRAEDVEVWFGISFYGTWAKLLAPFHWLVYGAGAWGFWKMSRWMHPWAAVYTAQIGIGSLIFAVLNGYGWMRGIIPVIIFAIPVAGFILQRRYFQGS